MPLYRYCGPADVDWLFATACAAYANRMKEPDLTRAWIAAQLASEESCFIRSGSTVVVANVTRRFYDPESVRAKVLFFWSTQPSPESLIHAFRGAAAWAKGRGARTLQFDESTGRDIAALAKRLGAGASFTSYALDL